jgi:hypothetical protein
MSVRHPITGALSNPERDRVRDRWNERYCASVLAASRPGPEPRLYPVKTIRACLWLMAGCAVIATLFMVTPNV